LISFDGGVCLMNAKHPRIRQRIIDARGAKYQKLLWIEEALPET
jgi:hypothetical protein